MPEFAGAATPSAGGTVRGLPRPVEEYGSDHMALWNVTEEEVVSLSINRPTLDEGGWN